VSIAAHELAICYSVYIGQYFYDADEEKERVEQAADFLIKKEQSFTAERERLRT
jgi:hypothetical protein